MSFKVSKSRAAVFLSYIEAETSVESHELSEFKKVRAMIFTNFTVFRLLDQIARDSEVIEIVSKRRAVFYNLLVSSNPLSKSKNHEICKNNDENFFEL